MKLFHSNYSGVDVGVNGKQFPVESAADGGVCVDVPDGAGPLLLEHGFRAMDQAETISAPAKSRPEGRKSGARAKE